MSNYPAPYGAPGTLQAGAGSAAPASLDLSRAVARIGEQCLWSTYGFDSGNGGNTAWGQENDVFASAINQAGQGFTRTLTRAETNLLAPSQMPVGMSFKVYGVAFHPYGIQKGGLERRDAAGGALQIDQADLLALQGYAVLQWRFQDTNIDIAPVQVIGAGGGTFGGTADTGFAYGGPLSGSMGSAVPLNHGGGSYWVYNMYHVQLQAGVTLRVRINVSSAAPFIDGGPTINDAPAYDVATRVMLFGVYEKAIAIG